MSKLKKSPRALLIKTAFQNWSILDDEYEPRDTSVSFYYDDAGHPVYHGKHESLASLEEIQTVKTWIKEERYEDLWRELLESTLCTYNDKKNKVFAADFVGAAMLYEIASSSDLDISLHRELFAEWYKRFIFKDEKDLLTFNIIQWYLLHDDLTSTDIDDIFATLDEIEKSDQENTWDSSMRSILYARADLSSSILLRELGKEPNSYTVKGSHNNLNATVLDDWSNALLNPNFPVELLDYAIIHFRVGSSRPDLLQKIIYQIMCSEVCSKEYYQKFGEILCSFTANNELLLKTAVHAKCSPELAIEALTCLHQWVPAPKGTEMQEYAVMFESMFDEILEGLDYDKETLALLPMSMKFHLLVGGKQ